MSTCVRCGKQISDLDDWHHAKWHYVQDERQTESRRRVQAKVDALVQASIDQQEKHDARCDGASLCTYHDGFYDGAEAALNSMNYAVQAVAAKETPMKYDRQSDTNELRKIGEWLNARFPTREDSDGDRVIEAANEIDRLQGRLR